MHKNGMFLHVQTCYLPDAYSVFQGKLLAISIYLRNIYPEWCSGHSRTVSTPFHVTRTYSDLDVEGYLSKIQILNFAGSLRWTGNGTTVSILLTFVSSLTTVSNRVSLRHEF